MPGGGDDDRRDGREEDDDEAGDEAQRPRAAWLGAQGVWWRALAFALLLVLGALLVALGGNDGNDLVDFVKRYADKVDLGVFDRQNGVFDFDGKNRQTKNAVVNWGLGAVVWLVIGKVVSGVIRK